MPELQALPPQAASSGLGPGHSKRQKPSAHGHFWSPYGGVGSYPTAITIGDRGTRGMGIYPPSTVTNKLEKYSIPIDVLQIKFPPGYPVYKINLER